jgi:hypothetical protein
MRRLASTLLALGATGLGLYWARQSAPVAPDGPTATAHALVARARAGDLEAWLDCFDGPLRQRLEAQLAPHPRDQAAARLRASVEGLTGTIVSDVAVEGDRATLRLEYLFAATQEQQRLRLVRTAQGWRIVGAAGRARGASVLPWGVPVEEADR